MPRHSALQHMKGYGERCGREGGERIVMTSDCNDPHSNGAAPVQFA